MVGEQLNERIAEAPPEAALNKRTATLATSRSPFASRRWMASRSEGRETSNCLASSRSGGNFSPGRKVLKNQKLQLLLNHIG
jgi:hypothetical protein